MGRDGKQVRSCSFIAFFAPAAGVTLMFGRLATCWVESAKALRFPFRTLFLAFGGLCGFLVPHLGAHRNENLLSPCSGPKVLSPPFVRPAPVFGFVWVDAMIFGFGTGIATGWSVDAVTIWTGGFSRLGFGDCHLG